MIDFKKFYKQIAIGSLSRWLEILPKQIITWQGKNLHGKFNTWIKIIEDLPLLIPQKLDLLHSVSTEQKNTLSNFQRKDIEKLLLKLIPWRKGPYSLYGIELDAEWQSNWKWQRLSSHISPLFNRTVLDVGCGNGYYMWRMIGAGAKLVIGIDPMQLYLCQFEAVRKLLGNDNRAHLLPLGIEQIPTLQAFDTVFSMGVLYHRRFPLDHLISLKNQLVTNGELVLETLIIDGKNNEALVPTKSYAKMHNVYFVPSVSTLKDWLIKCGFVDIRVIDTSPTSLEEQRRTKWMNGESLADFLDPKDRDKTVEGYPAPLRIVLVMRKP